ncbi:hypothetical protein AA313_de0206074 [Arthrobotrys entomopaga]|nr:hypothetical protein AA313_de0206074 [Arthrobotrys entomopaga]
MDIIPEAFDEDDKSFSSKTPDVDSNKPRAKYKEGLGRKNKKSKGKPKRCASNDDTKYTNISDWLDDRLDRVTKRRADAMVKAIRAGKKIAEADFSNVEDDPEDLLKDMPNIPWHIESRSAPEERAATVRQLYQRRSGESDEEYLTRLRQPLNPRLLLKSQKNRREEQNDDEMGFDHEGLPPPPPPRQGPMHDPSLEYETTIEEQFGHEVGENTLPVPQEDDGVWMRPMMRSWLWRLFFWRDERTFYPKRENMTVPKRYRFVRETFRTDENFERVHVCSPGESYFEHLYYSDKFFIWPDSLPLKPPGRSARDRWLRKLEVQQARQKPPPEKEGDKKSNKETETSETGGGSGVIGEENGSSEGSGDVGDQNSSSGSDTVVAEPKKPELNGDPETSPKDEAQTSETSKKPGLWSQVS